MSGDYHVLLNGIVKWSASKAAVTLDPLPHFSILHESAATLSPKHTALVKALLGLPWHLSLSPKIYAKICEALISSHSFAAEILLGRIFQCFTACPESFHLPCSAGEEGETHQHARTMFGKVLRIAPSSITLVESSLEQNYPQVDDPLPVHQAFIRNLIYLLESSPNTLISSLLPPMIQATLRIDVLSSPFALLESMLILAIPGGSHIRRRQYEEYRQETGHFEGG